MEYPYVLKYGSGGAKIQYYQFQLPGVRMIGKEEQEIAEENYLVVCSPEDVVSLEEQIGDVYCFREMDYENAPYDAVYVYGDGLRQSLEQAGYSLMPLE